MEVQTPVPTRQPGDLVQSHAEETGHNSLRFYSKHLVCSKRLSLNISASQLPETLAELNERHRKSMNVEEDTVKSGFSQVKRAHVRLLTFRADDGGTL